MKIVFISSSRIPSRTANIVQVMRMCEAFAHNGHDVTLFGRHGESTAANDHAEYGVADCFQIIKCRWPAPRVPGGFLYSLQVAIMIKTRIRPELLYARNLPTLAAFTGSSLPMVFEAHYPPPPPWTLLAARIFRSRNFRRLVVTSEALRKECQRLFPWLPHDRIRVAPNTADPRPVCSWSEVDRYLAGRTNGLRVGYVGSLYPGKGMEVVLPLAARCPEFDFHVVGGTEKDVRAWRDRSAGITNLRLHGHVSPASTGAYCQAMDVLLAPYQSRVMGADGQRDDVRWLSPLKIFEYMATGKAIVASDLPVLREVLRDGVNSLLVAPDDLTAWEHALRRLQDEALRYCLGENALRTLKLSYTWSARASKVLAANGALPEG